MSKNLQRAHISKRDWVLGFVVIALVLTNVAWFLQVQALNLSDKSFAENWISEQYQINSLKACIDQGTKPCNISPNSEM